MNCPKLKKFRIWNFRSIIDTGWRSLSNDNITILIGQNESGKTSILEALNSFYSGIISDDVLRSDNTLPQIACTFTIEDENKVAELIDMEKVPHELKDKIGNMEEFGLIRMWQPDKSSKLSVVGDQIAEYFENRNVSVEQVKKKSIEKTGELLTKNDKLAKQIEIATTQKLDIAQQLTNQTKKTEQKRRQHRKARKQEDKLLHENSLIQLQEQCNSLEDKQKELDKELEQLFVEQNNITELVTVGKALQLSIQGKNELEKSIADLIQKITELDHLFGLISSEESKKEICEDRKKCMHNLEKRKDDLTNKNQEVLLFTNVAYKVYNQDYSVLNAQDEAKSEIATVQQFYNEFSIAEDLFKVVPTFEFFEDFSGLLPNKIDLEDLLNSNDDKEGFKAAKNFLKLAGLDLSFFREKNQRILKQKIESLNSDITINFQDYWSQKVGKDDRIKLHFELEHYDYTIPEKSGKPYIEFWIKDKQERLYPKQRSRGVRWFLSFYLELKSAANDENRNRVLLIDEPGLSLHAKAQEDVLKVFEDLKDQMQIVYCTHSPHLVTTEKLYRILAVQRANEDDDKSETLVYDASMLGEASADTLTPVYSLMGVRLSDQQFVRQGNNVIVPDTITYYYLHWLSKLMPDCSDIHFIPATGMHTIPLLVNVLAGWQLNFGTVLFGEESKIVYKEIVETTLLNSEFSINKIMVFEKYKFVEDVFSVLDFKKYILMKREGITEQISEYILVNGLSRKILASNFINSINQGEIEFDTFDETTQSNINEMFDGIRGILSN